MALKRKGFLELRDEACRRLRAGALPPLLVITGENAYLKERVLGAAQESAKGEVELLRRFPEEDENRFLQRLLRAWTTPTLFGGTGMLLAREPCPVLRGERAALFEEVLALGQAVQPLVLTVTTLDGRSRLARRLKELGGLVALPVLRDEPPPWQDSGVSGDTELVRWALAEARHQGLVLVQEAAVELARRVGNEPARIAQKIEQLGVVRGDAGKIEKDLVLRYVPFSSAGLLNQYEEALRRADLPDALDLLDRMLRRGVLDPFGHLVPGSGVREVLLRGLVSRLARLMGAHERLSPELLGALGEKPWRRSADQQAGLDTVLGKGGARVFLERDLRATRGADVGAAFDLALQGARSLRDGRAVSLHALTVRLVRAFAGTGTGR